MSVLVVGTNRFENCEVLIAHREVPVLKIDISGEKPTLDLHMPDGTQRLVIEQNRVMEGEAEVLEGQRLVTITSADTLLLHVAIRSTGEAVVHIDLRPLGAAIYTDSRGLHVGSNLLSRNNIQGARVAIAIS
jgi:hypothetical protein